MFNHPLLTLQDEGYAYGEPRWISIGQLQALSVVVVVTERDQDVVRSLSARKATRYEVRHYEQAIEN